ncbi:MAG: tRNA (adenosine(37)-N6)-threonylcarbamoyltransferase complex ATPase subunit type 1 TsaE [Fimbriimonadaceae bacterium]
MLTGRLSHETDTRKLGAWLASQLRIGDWLLLTGELGAGKTTLVRGLLSQLGVKEGVRSPTYNLVATYETSPPVCHVDLYRVPSEEGLGLEEYEASHVLLVEWPDRLQLDLPREARWSLELAFESEGRRFRLACPPGRTPDPKGIIGLCDSPPDC